MKPKMILSIFVLIFVTTKPEFSLAVVKFANERIEEDIQRIYDRYPLIKKQLDKLSSSNLTYVIRYGHVEEKYYAIFETDGHNLFLTFRKTKAYLYSLHVCFAHEATHALQFERGQIGFFQNKDGNWSAVNVDLWDEAEAFEASLEVAGINDLCMNKLGIFMSIFKREYEKVGFEKAAQWLSHFYPKLSLKPMNNPDVTYLEVVSRNLEKMGYKLFWEAYHPSKILQKDYEKG
jgi:hypothetical protein